MVNNTETYWDVDGTSLHTYAWSIETMGGIALPNFRGEDITIPGQPGQTWVPKQPDSRILTLAMWLRGTADGAGAFASTKNLYQSAYNNLVRLLWTPGRQFDLTKRFYDGGVLKTAVAKGEFAGGLAPRQFGNSAGKCTIDIKLADPYFYETAFNSVNLAAGNNSVLVAGNAPTSNIQVNVVGPRVNPKLINSTMGVEFTYPRSLLTSETASIFVRTYDASELSGGAGTAFDTSSWVIHAGATQWLVMKPGTNTINLSSTSGIGTVQLQHKAAWV